MPKGVYVRVPRVTVVVRFWACVQKTSGGCWLWTKGVTRDGYGRFKHEGTTRRAHRVSWELTHGPIPNDLWVLHKCDNGLCVRPDHLFLGTAKDNTQDMIQKGRRYLMRGAEHHATQFTKEAVRQIRMRVASGTAQQAVADEFAVPVQTINGIVMGHVWGHAGGPIGALNVPLWSVRALVALAERRGTTALAELERAVRERADRQGIKCA